MIFDSVYTKINKLLKPKKYKASTAWITWYVEIFKNGKKVYEGNNTVVRTGEDFIAELLSKSLILWNQYENIQEKYIDFVSVWAWYKLAQDSQNNDEVVLPYDPVDWNEEADFYAGKIIKCISWDNATEQRVVISYDAQNKLIKVDQWFSNVPKKDEIYVIETDKREIQLQWEWQPDGNGNIISNTRKEVENKYMWTYSNEVVYECTWTSDDWAYVITEAWYFYNVDSALDGNSANHTPSEQKMFARVAFIDNPIYKSENDEVTIRWTFRVWDSR